MQYNSQEYIELLKQAKSFREKRQSFKKEAPNKYSSLLKYSMHVNNYIHWKFRNDYLDLMTKFTNFTISGKDFENAFCGMVEAREKEYRLLAENFNELEAIYPNPESFGFADWISEIYLCCDEFDPELQPQDEVEFPFAKTEKQFQAAIAEIIPQIQKYCNS